MLPEGLSGRIYCTVYFVIYAFALCSDSRKIITNFECWGSVRIDTKKALLRVGN